MAARHATGTIRAAPAAPLLQVRPKHVCAAGEPHTHASAVLDAPRPRVHTGGMETIARLLLILLLTTPIGAPAALASADLPALVFVARARAATPDTIFPGDTGPAGHLTTGLARVAPGSKLLLRDPDGTLRLLLDTALPAGDPQNMLGLVDLQSPDVAFDARQIVFAGATAFDADGQATWRIFRLHVDGTGLRQLTHNDRIATLPPAAAATYTDYDDLFPAFLADGRVVFSSSRYPSVAPYDARPTFNLYTIAPDGSDMRRITTERGGALHPTALPDGRIVFSRWWINFNQPSETGIYNRVDNRRGDTIVRNARGQPIIVSRETVTAAGPVRAERNPAVTTPVTDLVGAERVPPLPTAPPTASPRPTIWPTARPAEQRLTPLPTRTPVATPIATQLAVSAAATAVALPLSPAPLRQVIVERPLLGTRLSDGTLVYANVAESFRPARARLTDGTLVDEAPDSWHLMAIDAAGHDLTRYAWTPRFAGNLADDDGNDTFNAAQPALVPAGDAWLVAYTTQRDGTMAHTTTGTGVRVAVPGIAAAAQNTTESIAGHRWDMARALDGPYALAPAGLPDGRIIVSQSVDAAAVPAYQHTLPPGSARTRLRVQAGPRRYILRVLAPDGSRAQDVLLPALPTAYDAVDAAALVVRPVGTASGQWRLPVVDNQPAADDNPARWNVPRGLVDTFGAAAYPWSTRDLADVALVTIHNPNVYANPPAGLAHINNSPPVGSVAFADVYIDPAALRGGGRRAGVPDDQARAVKWITVPVDARGAFTASAPADVPMFIVLRNAAGQIVRGGNRGDLAIAQGNAPARAGRPLLCIGCHMGHTSGSLAGQPLAALGWTNIAPAATTLAPLVDRTAAAWMLRGEQQQATLQWAAPMAIHAVRLHAGTGALRAEIRFYRGAIEDQTARRTLAVTAQTEKQVSLTAPVAADRLVLLVSGTRGSTLQEVEVIGQGATAAALRQRPSSVQLPLIVR